VAADPSFLIVGHLRRPHGTRGEVFVEPLTDFPEKVFREGTELRVSDLDGTNPDELFPPLRIEANRPHKGGMLVRFVGIEDRDRLDFIRNRYLLCPFDRLEPLAEGELFQHQLPGLEVVTTEGTGVGRIREVYEHEPAVLLLVEGDDRELLIPFTREVVVSWDLEAGRLVVDPPEGLLDL
jgi:16S rRNA processing protein RimM